MTVEELLDRISSQELTAWMALATVEAEEEEDARDRASKDGDVIIHGRPDHLSPYDEPDDDEEAGPNGTPE